MINAGNAQNVMEAQKQGYLGKNEEGCKDEAKFNLEF